jgi:hypothetical protein
MDAPMELEDRAGSRLVVCIDDDGYTDDVKVRIVYKVLPDESAARSNYISVIDETGEDYLYPANLFVPIEPGAEWTSR